MGEGGDEMEGRDIEIDVRMDGHGNWDGNGVVGISDVLMGGNGDGEYNEKFGAAAGEEG